jgi:hypothetical protein
VLRSRELLSEVSKGRTTRAGLLAAQASTRCAPAQRRIWLRLKLIETTGTDRLTGEAAVYTLTDRAAVRYAT